MFSLSNNIGILLPIPCCVVPIKWQKSYLSTYSTKFNRKQVTTFWKNLSKLIAKLTSGLNPQEKFCKSNFWFDFFALLSRLFFSVRKPITIKNAWFFERTKASIQKVVCKSNFWMPISIAILFVSSCLYSISAIQA